MNNQNIYGDIESEETSTGNLFYSLLLDEQLTSSDDLSLLLEINDGSNIWGSIININMQAGMIVLNDLDILNGSTLNPGQQKEIKIYLENQGDVVLEDVQITLLNSGYFVDIVSGLGFFGDIYPGQIIGSNNQSSLLVQVDHNTINGATIHINANITSSNGYSRDIIITEYAGEATIMDPLGPDSHGYYIFDSNDLDYNLAPIYDWIEIDPNYGGDGEELNDINDNGDNGDDVTTIDLPFNFTFYGIEYDLSLIHI
mgnify:CR=1 FL=1